MKPIFGRVVLNDTAAPAAAGPAAAAVDGQGAARDTVGGRARACDAYRPHGWALRHEPAE